MKSKKTRQSPVVSSTVRLPPPPLPTTGPELLQFVGELMQRTDPRKARK